MDAVYCIKSKLKNNLKKKVGVFKSHFMKSVSRYLTPWRVTVKPEGLGHALVMALWTLPCVTWKCESPPSGTGKTVRSVGKGWVLWEMSDWLADDRKFSFHCVPQTSDSGSARKDPLVWVLHLFTHPFCSRTKFPQNSKFPPWHAALIPAPSVCIYEVVLISA